MPDTPVDPIEELTSFMADFGGENDRSYIILVASKLDTLLQDLLVRVLLPKSGSFDELFDGDAALSTFHAKINFAYRMGLISADLARALHLVRKIRNSFAHDLSVSSLETAPYSNWVRELETPFEDTWIIGYVQREWSKYHPRGSVADIEAVMYVIMSLLRQAIERAKRPEVRTISLVSDHWRDMSKDPNPPVDKQSEPPSSPTD